MVYNNPAHLEPGWYWFKGIEATEYIVVDVDKDEWITSTRFAGDYRPLDMLGTFIGPLGVPQ